MYVILSSRGCRNMHSECAVCISLLSSELAAGVITWKVYHARVG
jgi:hypothetical protein